jgi:hypothetical protein
MRPLPSDGAMAALDPASRLRLRGFALKLSLLAVCTLAFAGQGGRLFATASLFCVWYSIFAGIAALMRRERIGAPTLNGWDEMLAFDALALLARVLAGA